MRNCKLLRTITRGNMALTRFNVFLLVAFLIALSLYVKETKNIKTKIACPSTQEMVDGECFTPYVEYCDNRKAEN